MSNKRKHIRVAYNKKVRLFSDEHTFEAQSINISNSGIQVRTSIPSHEVDVERISLTLPSNDDAIHIPCRIVRSHTGLPGEDGHVLGLEFTYQTEAEMALVGNFIKEMKSSQLADDRSAAEMRIIPRTSCQIENVACSKPGVAICSIDNISTDGCLVSYEGELHTHEPIEIEFSLPGDSQVIAIRCSVAYAMNNYFHNVSRAGMCFGAIRDIDRIKIYNFIVKSASSSSVKIIQERRYENIIGLEYRICEPKRIEALFGRIKKEKKSINVLFENNAGMFDVVLTDFFPGDRFVTTRLNVDNRTLHLKRFHTVYCSVIIHGDSYYFNSELLEHGEEQMVLTFPETVYHSEKRSHDRKPLGGMVDFVMMTGGSSSARLPGRLVNISRRGFLCDFPPGNLERDLLKTGQEVSYFFGKDMGLANFGEIRHLKEVVGDDGQISLQVGIEAGIRRSEFQFKKISCSQWKKQKQKHPKRPTRVRDSMMPDIVRYENRSGRELVALLNYTRLGIESPVVILPPAFGKKKETLSPLVVTLFENFMHAAKDVITIRYDGINRPGESYNEDMCPKRGYEMLHYRISQGRDDLEATLDFVCNNDLFRPSAVIVVAFSMSAMDARKLIMEDGRVDYLVSVMGATCARSAFRNITGGIDIIGNSRIGIENGVSGVLGQILNLDTTARDLIDNKYAYIADARYDMTKIGIPVSWIYGKFDRWVSEAEVRDIMSVRSGGRREVIEIPTGHNLRSSEDAIKAFKIIAALIFRQVYGKTIRPFDPDRDAMIDLITYERERHAADDGIDMQGYWKNYLLGEKKNGAGYDFYRNLDEFREFLSFQGSLVDLKDGELMADMGCGTGIFFERMIADRAARGIDLPNAQVDLVDLVPEALARAREKFAVLKKIHGSRLPERVNYIQMNLEPNRLLPVKRLIEDRALDVTFLKNRVEGLKNTVVERLAGLGYGRLGDILRGAAITDDDDAYFNEQVNSEERRVIYDLNRAARLLTGNLGPSDFKKGKMVRDNVRENGRRELRAADIDFKELVFGDRGLDLSLDFREKRYDKIAASLLISYLFNPDEIILDFFRILKPGGLLLVSSMKPDSDISVIFTNYINKASELERENAADIGPETDLVSARAMLNEAASLFQLEEDGFFRFYTGEDLAGMMRRAGFIDITINMSMGNPPQAVIITGTKPGGTG